ncbi:MAG: hypothetical protein ACI9TY_001190 [Alphaproteobacteria bacterium]|jgi:hypothetical protein
MNRIGLFLITVVCLFTVKIYAKNIPQCGVDPNLRTTHTSGWTLKHSARKTYRFRYIGWQLNQENNRRKKPNNGWYKNKKLRNIGEIN